MRFILRILEFVFLVTVLIAAIGCGGGSMATPNNSSQQKAPTITFDAQPGTVASGASTVLSWNASNARSVSISGLGTFPTTGSVKITPTVTTTYSATATGPGGRTESSTVVSVTTSAQKPTAAFSAQPSNIVTGTSSVLSWTTTNATSVNIPGLGSFPADGSTNVTPSTTTTYTATAQGEGGTAKASTTVTVQSNGPVSQHVVLVIDENHSFHEVMVNMPWLVAEGDANGYAANFKSDNGGSLLDYLWLASGSCHSKANCTLPPGTHDFNCNGNDCYYPGTTTTDPITDDNIFRELNNAGTSWRVYAQSYAAAGGTLTTPDNANNTSYYRRHNGATWYADVLNDVDGSGSNVVDLSQLAVDEANRTLPRFMIIAPDGNHDAHDCPVGMQTCTASQKLGAADEFLRTTLTPILNTPDFQPGGDGLIIVTFDECGGGTDNGCGAVIYTAVIGPKVMPHTVSNILYKHENTLRTMLDALQITTYPGAAATAADMSDFFTTEGSKPEVTGSSPTDGASVSSPVKMQASAVPTAGHTISGWYVYIDNAPVYHAGAVKAIDPSLNMSTGTHAVIVRAWDTSGAYGDQTLSLTGDEVAAVRQGFDSQQ
jgi:phosphatidylinositol-3-phosphatase